MPLSEAVGLTRIAFAGTVSSLTSRNAPGGEPVTDVRFRNVRFAKGFEGPRPLVLTVFRGVAEMPEFKKGVRYVLLLSDLGTKDNGYLPVVGLTQGLFYVERDSTTHRNVVRDKGASVSEDEFLREIERLRQQK